MREDWRSKITLLCYSRGELVFWENVGRQRLLVKLLGRRWLVSEIEWGTSVLSGAVGVVVLYHLVETRYDRGKV